MENGNLNQTFIIVIIFFSFFLNNMKSFKHKNNEDNKLMIKNL